MSRDFDTLRLTLRRWDGRRRRQEFVRALPWALLGGLLIAGLPALLARSRPLLTRGEMALIAAGLPALGVAGAAVVVWLRPRSLADQARFGDRQFALRERATTAVEIQTGRLIVAADLAGRQLDDALQAATAVHPARQMPLMSRPVDWLPPLAVLAALLALLWLPNPQEAILREQRAVAETVAEQAAALSALAEEIAADETLTEAQREALQAPLDQAIATLEQPDLSREEAVAALSQAGAELRALSRDFEPATAETLAEAAAALGDVPAADELTQALTAGEAERAAAAMQGLADSLGDLSAEERAALAEGLAQAANAMSEGDAALADSLAEAAQALGEEDVAGAQVALDEAAATLEERAQAATAAARAAGAAEQLAGAQQAAAGGEPGESSAETGGATGGEAGGDAQGNASSGSATGEGTGTTGQGGPAPGGGHVENVFVPPSAGLESEGQALELETQCLTDPADCGPIAGQSPADPNAPAAAGRQVPYDRVFGDYRDAAFEALSSGDIPLRLQSLVRDYFTALEPGN